MLFALRLLMYTKRLACKQKLDVGCQIGCVLFFSVYTYYLYHAERHLACAQESVRDPAAPCQTWRRRKKKTKKSYKWFIKPIKRLEHH